MRDILLISRAWHFAAQRHSTQRRKGKAQEPYVNHLAEVAELVATATEGKDANLVAAAVLHDTVEDTATLPAELASVFNADIANLVAEVTDDKSLDKAERKKLQVKHASAKSERAKFIKLADKTSNLRSLVKSPPDDWSVQRRKEYLDWALEVQKDCAEPTCGWELNLTMRRSNLLRPAPRLRSSATCNQTVMSVSGPTEKPNKISYFGW